MVCHGIGHLHVISHIVPHGFEKAIAHALRTLTPVENNYSQIEKEALAIIYLVKEFHKLVRGRRIRFLTDHKHLLSIFGSNEGVPIQSTNRLQR